MRNTKLANLKGQKTKLLDKEVKTREDFEEVQAKLDLVEFKILQAIQNVQAAEREVGKNVR